ARRPWSPARLLGDGDPALLAGPQARHDLFFKVGQGATAVADPVVVGRAGRGAHGDAALELLGRVGLVDLDIVEPRYAQQHERVGPVLGRGVEHHTVAP